MGIPADWRIIEEWINSSGIPSHPGPENVKLFEKKNKEIPKLGDYVNAPNEDFWEKFPKNELPKGCHTRVNVRNLEKLVKQNEIFLTKSELNRASTIIRDLKSGADSYQLGDLPAISSGNSKSAFDYGELLTDKIATWIKDGYVAGPFNCPPMEKFRSNPLIAIARNGKVRPVVNMSGPKGYSFNDNLKKYSLEKVRMTTAKQFSYSLREAGKGAKFSKFDIVDAYKLIPARTSDLRLQGFKWLGKFFCETQQTFGAVPSVCNFDRLGSTIAALVAVKGEVPRNKISRTLDDFQCAGSKDSDLAEKFAKNMKEVCGFINVPLAGVCSRKEKAFELETRGSVLGTGFDSNSMTWFLTEEKVNKIKRRCLDACKNSHVSLKQMQELMGSVNDFTQMNRFLRFYKSSGNNLLSQFNGNENILLPMQDNVKKDLLVICTAADSSLRGLPIAERRSLPPLSALTFYSDAAGAKYCWNNKSFQLITEPDRGVACIGGDEMQSIWTWSRLSWPENFLVRKDDRGVEFGRKSTTLESIGMLLPFLTCPDKIAGRHVLFYIDNMAVYYGWENGRVKNDSSATVILKTMHILASFLGCHVHVSHVHRMSNDMASLADELSRRTKK